MVWVFYQCFSFIHPHSQSGRAGFSVFLKKASACWKVSYLPDILPVVDNLLHHVSCSHRRGWVRNAFCVRVAADSSWTTCKFLVTFGPFLQNMRNKSPIVFSSAHTYSNYYCYCYYYHYWFRFCSCRIEQFFTSCAFKLWEFMLHLIFFPENFQFLLWRFAPRGHLSERGDSTSHVVVTEVA